MGNTDDDDTDDDCCTTGMIFSSYRTFRSTRATTIWQQYGRCKMFARLTYGLRETNAIIDWQLPHTKIVRNTRQSCGHLTVVLQLGVVSLLNLILSTIVRIHAYRVRSVFSNVLFSYCFQPLSAVLNDCTHSICL